MAKYRAREVFQKEFVALFDQLRMRHNSWTVWCDLMHMGAVSISNAVAKYRWQQREESYLQCMRKYNREEQLLFPQLFAVIVEALEQNPDQDFLGDLYMNLNLSSSHKGQFFTPYNLCRCMAQMNMDGLAQTIAEKGWANVLDPCCGAGALFIAFANEAKRVNINYQTDIFFVAQDIDPVVAHMCYIQMSLLGMAGYVVIGDSLSAPAVSLDKYGLIPNPDQNIWYTPMYFRDVWQGRVLVSTMDLMLREGERNGEKEELVGLSA